MKASSASWVIVLFFGCAVVFALVHQVTKHSSTAVVVAAQFGTLLLILAVLVLVVRRFDRER